MSTDTTAAKQKRKGLRVALAVSLGFVLAVYWRAFIPFLGPLFAAQFLLASSRPMPLGKTVGAAIVILVAGIAMMVLTSSLADRPAPFLLLLGLTYFLCFAVQTSGKGGPAVFLVLVVAIVVPLFGILNKELANSILSILVGGVLSGTLLMWLAHAIIPETACCEDNTERLPAQPMDLLRAFANTLILLASVVICLTSNNLTAAAVIPITVASLLGQLDVAVGTRAAFGLVVVNLLGGFVASAAYAALTLRPNLLSIFLIVLSVALFLGGRAAAMTKDAPLFAGALTIFLILFGLGVSPLPGTAAESFATRIVYIAAALIYALLLATILWSRRPDPRRINP